MMDPDLQLVSTDPDLPDPERLRTWVRAALVERGEGAELTLRVVDEAEMRDLNRRYRGKDGPTNVLSFAYEAAAGVGPPLLGDLVVCAPVVRREATEQGKRFEDHFAHMVVHGCLHLLGYDHLEVEEARRMERLETDILREFQIANPYEET